MSSNWVYLRRILFVKLGRALRFNPEKIGRRAFAFYTGGGWREVEGANNGPLPTRPDLVCRLLRQR
jgi:hypothetical protein